MTRVTHSAARTRAASRSAAPENHALDDELLLGVGKHRIPVVAIRAHQRVRELVHQRLDAAVDAQPRVDVDGTRRRVIKAAEALAHRLERHDRPALPCKADQDRQGRREVVPFDGHDRRVKGRRLRRRAQGLDLAAVEDRTELEPRPRPLARHRALGLPLSEPPARRRDGHPDPHGALAATHGVAERQPRAEPRDHRGLGILDSDQQLVSQASLRPLGMCR